MCIAVPGRVTGIEGRLAAVDFNGNIVEAETGLVDVHVGDAVLVHAGCIIQVLSEQDSDLLLELLSEIESMR